MRSQAPAFIAAAWLRCRVATGAAQKRPDAIAAPGETES